MSYPVILLWGLWRLLWVLLSLLFSRFPNEEESSMPERYIGCRSIRRAVFLLKLKGQKDILGRGFNFESSWSLSRISLEWFYKVYKPRVYVIVYTHQIYLTKLSAKVGHSVFHRQAFFGVYFLSSNVYFLFLHNDICLSPRSHLLVVSQKL